MRTSGWRYLCRQQLAAGEQQRRRAVCHRGDVEQVERIADQPGLFIGFSADGAAEHGIGVVDRVGMRHQGEAAKGWPRRVVLVQVALHEQRRLGSRGQPLHGLIIAVHVEHLRRFSAGPS